MNFYVCQSLSARLVTNTNQIRNNLNNTDYVTIIRSRGFEQTISQPAITCSKLTIETLEQGVKYVQSLKLPERRQSPVTLLLILNIFHTLF